MNIDDFINSSDSINDVITIYKDIELAITSTSDINNILEICKKFAIAYDECNTRHLTGDAGLAIKEMDHNVGALIKAINRFV